VLAQIATPPNLETGILCIFLSPGASVSPCFSENEITKGTIKTPNRKDTIAPIICASDNLIMMVFLPFYILTNIVGILSIISKNVPSSYLIPIHYRTKI